MTNLLKKHSKMLTLGRTLRKEENGQDSSHGQLQRSPMDPLVIRLEDTSENKDNHENGSNGARQSSSSHIQEKSQNDSC